MILRKRSLDSITAVRLRRARSNARITQPLIRRQRFEQVHRSVEEIRHFFRGLVIGVTVWVKSRDTSAVLAPFVLPEGFRGAGVRGPVLLHELQERWIGCLDDG